jgi:hypothetical protein
LGLDPEEFPSIYCSPRPIVMFISRFSIAPRSSHWLAALKSQFLALTSSICAMRHAQYLLFPELIRSDLFLLFPIPDSRGIIASPFLFSITPRICDCPVSRLRPFTETRRSQRTPGYGKYDQRGPTGGWQHRSVRLTTHRERGMRQAHFR